MSRAGAAAYLHAQQQSNYQQADPLAIIYGRQPRTLGLNLGYSQPHLTHSHDYFTYERQPRPPLSKTSNLAGVLSAAAGPTMPSELGPSLSCHHLTQSHYYSTLSGASGGSSRNFLKYLTPRWSKRISLLAGEYRTVVEYSIFFILLALCIMLLLKFTLLSATLQQATTPHQATNPLSSSSRLGSNNNLYYPPPLLFPKQEPHWPQQTPSEQLDAQQAEQSETAAGKEDILSSKLLIGEFVLLSHNYSNSAAQRALLMNHLTKLMDQVFLSSNMRQVYSRMEVTGIRPAASGNGVLVDYNIILSVSIEAAAQQFGLALWESLSKSQGLLANQANYIIDRNSIKFNTVPDKDLKSGIVPAGLVPISMLAPSVGTAAEPSTSSSNQDNERTIIWSEWSQWSSCVDKNGVCDPARIHSRIRQCVIQQTGEKVDAKQCIDKFQPPELELADCTSTCSQQDQQHLQSDAPSSGPQTAPSVLVEPAAFLPAPKLPAKLAAAAAAAAAVVKLPDASTETYTSSAALPSLPSLLQSSTTERADPLSTPTSLPLTELQQQAVSCSNCTSQEICLLLINQKVPFCAKIKDRQDESGCGGWCKAQSQLCQPIGQNAFKCIHDSECLADEWRCHDGACIPLSKRCDGHSNCYDNSDERDCPLI